MSIPKVHLKIGALSFQQLALFVAADAATITSGVVIDSWWSLLLASVFVSLGAAAYFKQIKMRLPAFTCVVAATSWSLVAIFRDIMGGFRISGRLAHVMGLWNGLCLHMAVILVAAMIGALTGWLIEALLEIRQISK